MAKRQKVNKTQAVGEYLRTHRGAKSSEIANALTKQGIKITVGHVANIKSKLKKQHLTERAGAAKPVAGIPGTPKAEPAPAAVESSPTKPANVITLEQIKIVGAMVKTIGGFRRLHEMLGVIKEVGGLKKFKDLLEAMTVREGREAQP
jgi:hypothetical protein